MTYATREEWLVAGMHALGDRVFKRAGYPIPPDVKVTCGWTGRGKTKGTLGQCWPRSASAAGVNEVFIAPIIDRPFAAVDTLAHELIHAITDPYHGHGRHFRTIAKAIGMVGRMKSAAAGPELAAVIDGIVADLGVYPHARLDFAQRAQSTRMLKCWCATCGYLCRVSSSWLDAAGPPFCPTHNERMKTEHTKKEERPEEVKRITDRPTLTDEDLERAIRAARRARQRTHPDKGGSAEHFRAAQARFDELAAERERRRAAA